MNDRRQATWVPCPSERSGALCSLSFSSTSPPAPSSGFRAFARKYRVTCTLCHRPFPRLSAFGGEFAGNGFELAVAEAPRDTLSTGDPLLRLGMTIPLAIRVDAYVSALANEADGISASDLKTPYGIKLLSGGQVADKVSYYLYFLLTERGEVAGLEDAYLQFTDILGSGVSAFFTGLVNWMDADRPVVSLRLGEQDESPGYLKEYRTVAVGASWLWRRNVRALGELGWDFTKDRARVTVGTSVGF